MNARQHGILAMIGACTIWGLSSLLYKQLADVPPITVLAHRTLWSLVFFAGVLALQGRIGQLPRVLGRRSELRIIGLAALTISSNWFLFIFSIGSDHAVEASLGYYIFPLVAVVLGRVVFAEALGRWQWAAVGLAGAAVSLLTWGLGVAPWISLLLAGTFGLYGVLKKQLDMGPILSVTGEVVLLLPVALGVLMVGGFHMGDGWHTVFLMLSGPLTGLPLILFSYASRRIPMATLGLLQYLNPTLQFMVATLVFREAFGIWHAAAFAMIWTALAIYSGAGWRAAARKAASASGIEATMDTKSSMDGAAKP